MGAFMRTLIIAFAITAVARFLPAQQDTPVTNNAAQQTRLVYGDKTEMRGLTHLYVDTGADLKQRADIIKRIRNEEELVSVIVVAEPESGELFLYYRGGKATSCDRGRMLVPTQYGVIVTSGCRDKKVGYGLVARPGAEGQIRLLLSEEGGPEKITKAFVKAYQGSKQVTIMGRPLDFSCSGTFAPTREGRSAISSQSSPSAVCLRSTV